MKINLTYNPQQNIRLQTRWYFIVRELS